MKKILLIILLITTIAHSHNIKYFFSTTESSTKKWANPSEKISEKIIIESNTKIEIDEWMSQQVGINKYSDILSFKELTLSKDKNRYFFVRPSTGIFSPFYGAHTFSHWIVDSKGNIIHSASSDKIEISGKFENQFLDLKEYQCRGGSCYIETFVFTNGRYQFKSCSTQDIDSKKINNGCEK